MENARIRDFIASQPPQTPCLIIDLDVVDENYRLLSEALPEATIYYAVKANPDSQVLSRLYQAGSSFDTASFREIELALIAGADPRQISFGNTIKKEREIVRAHHLGVDLFAVDSVEEVEKVSRAAPGARIYCRILTDGEGAEWPLSRKFGCTPRMAEKVLLRAAEAGLVPAGISFHVGSQMTNVNAWDRAIADARAVFTTMTKQGINLTLLNMGGGFPTRYLKDIPSPAEYGAAIRHSLTTHFGKDLPDLIIEPGRSMVGNAGSILSEVLLTSRKDDLEATRWVFLDIGKFGGLAETMDEAIRYRITTSKDNDEKEPSIVAGPTCDSADVLYEKTPYMLPKTLVAGDFVVIEDTGAYTKTYSSVAFNGFEPLKSYNI